MITSLGDFGDLGGRDWFKRFNREGFGKIGGSEDVAAKKDANTGQKCQKNGDYWQKHRFSGIFYA